MLPQYRGIQVLSYIFQSKFLKLSMSFPFLSSITPVDWLPFKSSRNGDLIIGRYGFFQWQVEETFFFIFDITRKFRLLSVDFNFKFLGRWDWVTKNFVEARLNYINLSSNQLKINSSYVMFVSEVSNDARSLPSKSCMMFLFWSPFASM